MMAKDQWDVIDECRRAEEERERAAYPLRCWDRCAIPPRVKAAVDSATLIETPALVALRKRWRGTNILTGGFGTGKSVAAGDLAKRHVLANPYYAKVRWMSAGELGRIDRYSNDLRDLITKPTLLVVDDVGVEPADARGFFAATLDELIDGRHVRNAMTVLTTNHAPVVFAERYGGRILDRVREDGAIVICGSKSLRGAK